MSLASLLLLYGSPGNQYATAKAVGDGVAQTRMRYELALAVRDELVPAMQDRLLTGTEWNQAVNAHEIVFDGQPPFASITAPAEALIEQQIRAKFRMGVTRMDHIVGVLSQSLAQLRGEFPTAPGVTNAANAIYPGTRVYAATDAILGSFQVLVAIVTEDNGDDPIEVTIGGDPYTIARSHIHFEYTDAVDDASMANVMLYTYYTDGADSWPVITINALPIGTIVLDDGNPSGITVTVAELVDLTWIHDSASDAIISALALYQWITKGANTWPIVTLNAFPVATAVLDDGNPGGLTVPYQDFVDAVWAVNAPIQAVLDGLAPAQNFTDGADTWPVVSFTAMPTGEVVLDDGNPGGLTITYQDIADGTWTLVP